jgi:hypothetical protein
MKISIYCAALLIMCACGSAFAQQVPDVWLGCKKKIDCSMVQSVCNAGMLPVNVENKKKLEEHVAHLATMVKCARPNKPVKSSPECVDQKCVIKVPQTPIKTVAPIKPKYRIIRYEAGSSI